MFGGTDSTVLQAVPFFLLAGALMDKGGISRRLINFANVLVGWVTGGLAMVSVVASMFFAGISGSAAADSAAVGSVMIPAMARKGYAKDFAAALIACAGTIGTMIPPSIPMIIYGVTTGTSIGALFIAGRGSRRAHGAGPDGARLRGEPAARLQRAGAPLGP